jgi:hypothetical protein
MRFEKDSLRPWLIVICALFLVTMTQSAFGQGAVTSGTIAGYVYDKSGGVIPQAKVTVTNEGTGVEQTGATDSYGHFSFPNLPAGSYLIRVQMKGFQEATIKNFQLNLGAQPSLKFTLIVGQSSQTVEVSASAVQVETTKTEISSVISQVQVHDLPLNQLSFTSLVTQQPGLVNMTNTSGNSTQTPTSVTFAQGSQISADGMVTQSMSYLVDGVNINNSGFGAPGTAAGGDIPGVEAIQEFKVLTHNYSARYGGSAGAVVSFVTRSGTNQLHGSLYEYLRNDIFDARDFFDTLSQKPPFRRNQFGVTLGGPVKKNKSFIFANYEGLRSRLTTTTIGNVPTACARNGGVGGSCNFPVTDALGNPVAISSGVKSILSLYPEPNGTDFGNGIGQYLFPNRQPVRQDFGLVRFDQTLGTKDSFMARYSVTDAGGSNAYFLPSYQFNKYNRLQSLVLKWTHVYSPHFVNTLSFGVVRSLLDAVVAPTVPISPDQYTGNPSRAVVGTISVGSATSGNTSGTVSTIGLDNWGPFHGVQNTFPLNYDAVWTAGKHTLSFGGEFVPMQWNWAKGNLIGGGWTFNSLNDLLAGDPAVLIIRQDGANPSWGFRTKQLAWYMEDAWQLKPNFTLTLGLRHQFQVPILSEVNNKLGNVRYRTEATPHVGQPFNNYSLKEFQPRVGIAWDPFNNGKTVIRSGFGLFYDFIPMEALAGEISYNDPQPTLNTFFGAPIAPGYLPQIPFPNCDTSTFQCTPNSGYPGLLTGVLEPVRAPTSAQWSLEVRRQLPAKLTLALTYAGSSTWNIMRGIEGNSSLPCSTDSNGVPYFGASVGQCGTAAPGILSTAFTLYAVQFDGHASYNAGTLQLERQFSNDLAFSTSFTWAKAMSDSDTNNSGAILLGNASHSEDPLNPSFDRSLSMFSIKRRMTANMVYRLPFGKGKRFLGNAHGVLNQVLGGWRVSTLAVVEDGLPFSVLDGVGITNVGDSLTYPDRPNILRANPVLGGTSQYFDPKAYALQDPGYLGTATRNSVIGPGLGDWDISLAKTFQLTEKYGLQFQAQFFNLLNHPNFNLPSNQLYVQGAQFTGSTAPTQAQMNALTCNLTVAQAWRPPGTLPSSGYSCNPQAGIITSTVGTPRQIQFALKLSF